MIESTLIKHARKELASAFADVYRITTLTDQQKVVYWEIILERARQRVNFYQMKIIRLEREEADGKGHS